MTTLLYCRCLVKPVGRPQPPHLNPKSPMPTTLPYPTAMVDHQPPQTVRLPTVAAVRWSARDPQPSTCSVCFHPGQRQGLSIELDAVKKKEKLILRKCRWTVTIANDEFKDTLWP